jgi:hypothetical protein
VAATPILFYTAEVLVKIRENMPKILTVISDT